jgi:hypothetical protein
VRHDAYRRVMPESWQHNPLARSRKNRTPDGNNQRLPTPGKMLGDL